MVHTPKLRFPWRSVARQLHRRLPCPIPRRRPVRTTLAGLLAIAALVFGALVVEAATTPWSCDKGGNNNCPSGSKYSRSKMKYTILGGNGAGTNWRIEKRTYGGSQGGSDYDDEEWQLYWGGDFQYENSDWTRLHKYGASSWYQNVNPWKDKTISGVRNIYGKEGISWYTVFRHVHCYSEDVEIYGCNYHTKYREQENSVFN